MSLLILAVGSGKKREKLRQVTSIAALEPRILTDAATFSLHFACCLAMRLCNVLAFWKFFKCSHGLFTLNFDIHSLFVSQVDELDYDARLAAYRSLTPENWNTFVGSRASILLLHRVFLDLQSIDDLALRHAAAQALSNFVKTGTNNAVQSAELNGLSEDVKNDDSKTNPQNAAFETKKTELIMTVVFPLTKKSVAASNLAVRQVAN